MRYSILLYEREAKPLTFSQPLIDLFRQDADCCQMVLSCRKENMGRLPLPDGRTAIVRQSPSPYVALLAGLKAVQEENVLIAGWEDDFCQEQVERVKTALESYPAVCLDALQGFDTRLVMFSLQQAIDYNLAVHSYMDAVSQLADTPVKCL